MTLLDTILRRPPVPSCQEMVELMTAYLEGGLSPQDRKRFERHIKACGNCSRYLDQVRATIAATGQLQPDALSDAAMEELRAAFRDWHDQEEPSRDD